jgi:hypothetical protein
VFAQQEVPGPSAAHACFALAIRASPTAAVGIPSRSYGAATATPRAALEFPKARRTDEGRPRLSSSAQPCQPACWASRRSCVEMPLLTITTVVEPADSENHSSIVCRFDGASSTGQVICSLRGRSMSAYSPLGADLGRRLPIRAQRNRRRITSGLVRASNTVIAIARVPRLRRRPSRADSPRLSPGVAKVVWRLSARSCVDTCSQRVASAFPRMQERRGLRSRAGRHLQVVRCGRVRRARRHARIHPTAEAWPRDTRALRMSRFLRRGVTERARTRLRCRAGPARRASSLPVGTWVSCRGVVERRKPSGPRIRVPPAAALRAS